MSHCYYVIDGDGVLCDEFGAPIIVVGKPSAWAITLGFGEVHDGVVNTTNTADLSDSPFVISKNNAIDAGLIFPYGDKFDSPSQKSLSFISYRSIVGMLDTDIAHTLSRAIQLVLWQADHHFCSRCGKPTRPHKAEHAMLCTSCRHRAYPRVQPCVITAITRIHQGKRQILLALHHRHKDTGMYGLIAGFVEAGETLEDSVRREALEEVGVQITNLRYLGSQPWPYPTNLMTGFIADYDGGDIKIQENELADARFFDIDDLPIIPKFGSIAHTLIQQVISLP